jgi:hypothetical protein
MKEILVGKIRGHLSFSISTSLLGVSTGYCQRALVTELGMIGTQMGNIIDQ